jgi:hypothetical protein
MVDSDDDDELNRRIAACLDKPNPHRKRAPPSPDESVEDSTQLENVIKIFYSDGSQLSELSKPSLQQPSQFSQLSQLNQYSYPFNGGYSPFPALGLLQQTVPSVPATDSAPAPATTPAKVAPITTNANTRTTKKRKSNAKNQDAPLVQKVNELPPALALFKYEHRKRLLIKEEEDPDPKSDNPIRIAYSITTGSEGKNNLEEFVLDKL